MNKKIAGCLLLIGFIISGCSTKGEINQLSEKEILIFQLEGQMGVTVIRGDSIFVKVSDDIYLTSLSSLSASNIKISDYAVISPKVGEKQDFSKPVKYTVRAQDGSTKAFYVIVLRAQESDLQLPNSSFDKWHQATHGDAQFIDIGENVQDKTWGTGNRGAAFAIGMGSEASLPSVPVETSANKYAAQVTTQNMGAMAALPAFGAKGIAAGSIFVGEFEIASVFDAHPVFGIPFTQTPVAFQVDYKYLPGSALLDGTHKPISGKDALDFYLILEKREGAKVKRLGIGWFRSSDTQTEWKTKEVEIKYALNGQEPVGIENQAKYVLKYGHDGDIAQTDPSKMPKATWGDISKDRPTHIFVVFTSSYQGDYFIGAPGSRLTVDNFKLIY